MRVLLVHNQYQQYGGEDAVVALERETLARRGVTVTDYYRHNDEIKAFNLLRRGLVPFGAVHSGRTVADVRAAIDASRPDIAYVHNVYPLISPSVYAALGQAGIPAVQVAHNFRPFCSNGLFHRRGAVCEDCLGRFPWPAIVNRCFRGSLAMSTMYAAATLSAQGLSAALAAFICPTRFTSGKLAAAGISPDRLFIRPNFITPDPRLPVFGAGRYALYLGRLSAEKGIGTVLDAFARTPEIELVIAGAGPLEQELRDRIAVGKLRNVRMAGFVSGEVKRGLLENAMFVVVPSESYEGFPMSVLEAFRAGKPTIASRIGGLQYVVQDGATGLLFEPGDAASLAALARELAREPLLRATLGRAARRVSEKDYGPDTWFNRTMEIFRAALDSGTSAAPVMVEAAAL